MAHHALLALGRAVLLHPVAVYLIVFVAPVAVAYWRFAVSPYRRGQTDLLLSPWRAAQPAIPGVLERYPAWEWVGEGRLNSFGRWLYEELARRDLSLAELAQRAGLEVNDLLPILSAPGARPNPDPRMLRILSALQGASDIESRPLHGDFIAGAETKQLP